MLIICFCFCFFKAFFKHCLVFFLNQDSDVRLARRVKRDTKDWGRNIEYVLDQYSKFVKPSFEEFVLPSKKYADIIIPRGSDNDVAIDLIVQHIHTKLEQHDLCKIYPNVFVIHSTYQVNRDLCKIYPNVFDVQYRYSMGSDAQESDMHIHTTAQLDRSSICSESRKLLFSGGCDKQAKMCLYSMVASLSSSNIDVWLMLVLLFFRVKKKMSM